MSLPMTPAQVRPESVFIADCKKYGADISEHDEKQIARNFKNIKENMGSLGGAAEEYTFANVWKVPNCRKWLIDNIPWFRTYDAQEREAEKERLKAQLLAEEESRKQTAEPDNTEKSDESKKAEKVSDEVNGSSSSVEDGPLPDENESGKKEKSENTPNIEDGKKEDPGIQKNAKKNASEKKPSQKYDKSAVVSVEDAAVEREELNRKIRKLVRDKAGVNMGELLVNPRTAFIIKSLVGDNKGTRYNSKKKDSIEYGSARQVIEEAVECLAKKLLDEGEAKYVNAIRSAEAEYDEYMTSLNEELAELAAKKYSL